jgi:hypothetical protein
LSRKQIQEEKDMQLQGNQATRGEHSMGYNIVLLEQRFVIRKERKSVALESVKQAIRQGVTLPSVSPGGRVPFRFEHERAMLSSRTLEGLLRVCGFTPQTRAGNIVGLELDSETEYREEMQLFELLGPFVEPGFLEFTNDDDTVVPERWRDNFSGTRHQRVYPLLKWPSYRQEQERVPEVVYRLTEDQKRVFEGGRIEAGEPPFFSGGRVAVTLLAHSDPELSAYDIACLDALVGHTMGLRITFTRDLPAETNLLVIEEYRRHGCDVEPGTVGFLAAPGPLFDLEQYRWWIAQYWDLAPEEPAYRSS